MGVTKKNVSTVEELMHEVGGKLDAEGRNITGIETDLEDDKSGVNVKTLRNGLDEVIYSIDKLHSEIMQSFPLTYGYVNTSGAIQGEGTDVSWSHTPLLRIKVGSTVTYAGTGTPSNVLQVVFVKEDGTFISGIAGGTDGSTIAPNDTFYVRFCSETSFVPTSSISATLYNSIVDEVNNKANTSDIVDTLTSTKTTKPLSANQGRILNGRLNEIYSIDKLHSEIMQSFPLTYGYVNVSGGIEGEGTDMNWSHTPLLRVKVGSTVTYAGTGTPSNVLQVVFVKEDGTFISGIAGGTDGSTIAPNDTFYVRFCSDTSFVPTSSISATLYNNIVDEVNNKANTSDIVDTLTSTEIAKPLSAKQGNVLNEKINKVIASGVLIPSKNYNYDINHFIVYGQSLSQGDWTSIIISDIQKYNSLMFNGGMRVWENRSQAIIYDALIPAVETSFVYLPEETVVGAPVRGETPCSGIANKIIELISEEDGFSHTEQQYQMLLSAPGMGGKEIAALSDKVGIYYQRLIADVTNGKRLAEESGKTFWCPAVTWIQGEADTYYDMSQTDYYNAMVSLFSDLNTDIKAITNQNEDVQFFLYQTQAFDWYYGGKFTYPDVPLAQLQITRDFKNVHLATPIYHLPHISNDCHFTAIGSKWFGGYFGIAYKRVVIDELPLNSIDLESYSIEGNNIYLKFKAPVYPLKFDTVNVVDRGVSKGFQIREVADRSQDSYLDIITNVEINKYNTIKITCSTSPGGKKLTYAINGTSVSDTSSGNLRDSQEIKFSFKDDINDVQETAHDMYNWCPLFEQIL